MKNILFLFDLSVYSVQILSLLLTFFLFLKLRSKSLKYYCIILLVTLLDNVTNSVRDFVTLSISPPKIVYVCINYSASLLLTIWFFYSARLVHEVTKSAMTKKRYILIFIASLYPVYYSVSDYICYGVLKWIPSKEAFSYCTVSTYILNGYYFFIFLYASFILYRNKNTITDKKAKQIIQTGLLFFILLVPAFVVDLTSVLHGFYLYVLLLMIWNILNIIYLWKNYYSQKTENKMDSAAENLPLKIGTITVKDDGGYIFIKYDDIVTVRASNKKTVLRTVNRAYVTDYSLSELDGKSSEKLIRVHRNTVINPGKIKKIEKYFAGTFAVIMENDEIVEMSRRVSSEFRKKYLQ